MWSYSIIHFQPLELFNCITEQICGRFLSYICQGRNRKLLFDHVSPRSQKRLLWNFSKRAEHTKRSLKRLAYTEAVLGGLRKTMALFVALDTAKTSPSENPANKRPLLGYLVANYERRFYASGKWGCEIKQLQQNLIPLNSGFPNSSNLIQKIKILRRKIRFRTNILLTKKSSLCNVSLVMEEQVMLTQMLLAHAALVRSFFNLIEFCLSRPLLSKQGGGR